MLLEAVEKHENTIVDVEQLASDQPSPYVDLAVKAYAWAMQAGTSTGVPMTDRTIENIR